MELPHIDHCRPFDWGRASADYARWRDIYPPEFFRPLTERCLCGPGRKVLDLGTGTGVLDLGTGTGVLPRALYRQGARFTGVDPAPGQIRQARALANRDGLDIDFRCAAAEDCRFPDGSFDTATACQCFTYFDHARLAPRLHRMLKPGGIFAVLYMAWLPEEDPIAGQSETLILRHNPAWTGCGETRHPIAVPADYGPWFAVEAQEVFDLRVPFTRESWNGRIRACRGVGAALPPEEVERFDREHRALLAAIAPEKFSVLHYAAVTLLRRRDGAEN